ncbi:MAG: bifunctional N(6)-L-threonylcarbamoyladenine synthase/serine/threonine protein kinase [DPANN group archaeon]|nr:bifunctional N(6)-L-threonylcarbamoyladenine synthase/serine/threonine protein kinase [DPANN group archaeon]
MIVLGIESTAHTFGAGIMDGQGNALANVKDSYVTKKGGMIPARAAQHHVEVCGDVIRRAMETARLRWKDIDAIAFSQGPGIGHSLRIGAMMTRSLASRLGLPLVGVNHCIAHLEIGRVMTRAKDPVLLYVSGANTQIIAYEGKKYRIFGETLDIGVGNLLDSFARTLGLGFPGGPKIAELASKGKTYIKIPYAVKGMDVSFGGINTFLKNMIREGKHTKEDLCYSLQETIFAMLLEVSERAMAHCGKNELVLGGGVACNTRLQEMAGQMCRERGARMYVPENQYLTDNGAMIAWLGLLQYKAGNRTSIEESVTLPYQRTDDVEVTWRN